MSYLDYLLSVLVHSMLFLPLAVYVQWTLLRLTTGQVAALSFQGFWGGAGAQFVLMFRATRGLAVYVGLPAGLAGVSLLFWFFQLSMGWYWLVIGQSLLQSTMVLISIGKMEKVTR